MNTAELVRIILDYDYLCFGSIENLQIPMAATWDLWQLLQKEKSLYPLLFAETLDTEQMRRARASLRTKLREVERREREAYEKVTDLLDISEYSETLDLLLENEPKSCPGSLIGVWSEACALVSFLHNEGEEQHYAELLPHYIANLELLKNYLRSYFFE